jgi:hypothetical protein
MGLELKWSAPGKEACTAVVIVDVTSIQRADTAAPKTGAFKASKDPRALFSNGERKPDSLRSPMKAGRRNKCNKNAGARETIRKV